VIAGLDSSFTAPSAAQADAAAAAGVRVWSGYLATRAGVRLAAPWPELAFANAKRCGGRPLAFCSGWDDPTAVRQLAAAWGVLPCLDCEPEIRDLGSWTQGWLDEAGAGLYGSAHVHGLRAAFHIIARYPGRDPGATWPADVARPAAPCGWQWQGTHTEFGCSVDRGWFDDWFGGGDDVDPTLQAKLDQLANVLLGGGDNRVPNPAIFAVLQAIRGDDAGVLAAVQAQQQRLTAVAAELDALKAEVEAGGSVDAAAALARIEAAFRAA
jgi:hypothetical protein